MASPWNLRSTRALARGAAPVLTLVLAVNCGGGGGGSSAPSVAKPVITTQPMDHTATAGQYVSLSVAATGTDLTYKWMKNGAAIPGLSSATYYSFLATQDLDGARYSVEVSNPGGKALSQAAVLHVLAADREVIVNGSFETLGPGGNATGWTFSDANMTVPYSAFSLQAPPSAGLNFLGNGYWGAVKSDSVYQTFTVPVDAVTANLTFTLAVANTFVLTQGLVVNTYTAKLKDTSGNDVLPLVAKSDQDSAVQNGAPVVTSYSFDLMPYRGQTLRIYFESNQTDATKNTLFMTDRVSLNVTF
ncbi:MAG TPA: immunoglobulin domain-containing protein [Holophagaceae bacterium]|nr:immunoglobulin domain-containing protein [Holophagaceae bacterium]